MKIYLSPQRRDAAISVTKQGDALTINGTDYDFSQLPDGGELPREAIDCEWICSDVSRVDGEIELTLILPHNASASETARFPESIMNPADGQVELPQ